MFKEGFENLAQDLYNEQKNTQLGKKPDFLAHKKRGRPVLSDENRMSDGNSSVDDVLNLPQEQQDAVYKKINSHIEGYLERSGFLKMVGNKKTFDFSNFDINKFVGELEKKVYIGRASEDLNTNSILIDIKTIFNALQQINVVDKNGFENNLDNQKERFIVELPNNAKDFFNIDNLKKLGVDEENIRSFIFRLGEDIVLKNGEIISIFEIKVFQRIFGKFKAQRDERGKLLIWDQSKNEFVKFNLTTVRNNKGSKDVFSGENIINKCPNLFNLQILKLGDFNINTQQYSGELLRKEFELSDKSGAKYVMIKGARYYIGRKFFEYKNKNGNVDKISTDQLKVVLLDRDHAGIVEVTGNKEELKYVWDLVDIEDIEAKKQEVQSRYNRILTKRELRSRLDFGKDELVRLLEKWNITTSCPPKENESNEDYFNRIKNIGSYEYIKNVGDEFSKKALIGIHNLSWKEQQWLASAYYELENREELFDLARKYGKDGLSTFVSCEDDVSSAHKILEIGELLDKKISDKDFNNNVFQRYSKILSITDKIIEGAQEFFTKYLSEDFNERKLRTQLLSGSTSRLNVLYEKLKELDNEEELKDAVTNILNDFDNTSKQKTQTLNLLKGELSELENLDAFYGTSDDNKKKNETLIENAKKKIINLLYEKEIVNLPENFRNDISEQILEYSREIPDTNKNVYLPVGITSKPEFGGVEKPIDSLAYIFWLNNQKKRSELVIIDSIQKTNYELLYDNGNDFPLGLVGGDPKIVAEEMGGYDKQFYNTYKKTFNLSMDVLTYPKENDEEFLQESLYINNLYQNKKNIARTFDSMVEPSVLKKAKARNPNKSEEDLMSKLSQYPKDEVAIILAKNGLKISHEKECRYDILAKITSIYKLLNENKDAVNIIIKKNKIGGLDLEDSIMNLAVYLSCLEDVGYNNYLQEIYKINTEIEEFIREAQRLNRSNIDLEQSIKKLEIEKTRQSDFGDIKNNMINPQIEEKKSRILLNNNTLSEISSKLILLQEQLRQVKIELEKYLNNNADISNISTVLNKFYSSSLFKFSQDKIVGIYSSCAKEIKKESWFDDSRIPEFYYPKNITGMSFELKSEGKEERVGFREFYSSYTSNRQDWIHSNQVIANPEASIAKFSVLSKEVQLEYFEKIIKPIVINYYVAMYRSKEQARSHFLEDFKNVGSPMDALLFIKNNIIDKTRDAYSIII